MQICRKIILQINRYNSHHDGNKNKKVNNPIGGILQTYFVTVATLWPLRFILFLHCKRQLVLWHSSFLPRLRPRGHLLRTCAGQACKDRNVPQKNYVFWKNISEKGHQRPLDCFSPFVAAKLFVKAFFKQPRNRPAALQLPFHTFHTCCTNSKCRWEKYECQWSPRVWDHASVSRTLPSCVGKPSCRLAGWWSHRNECAHHQWPSSINPTTQSLTTNPRNASAQMLIRGRRSSTCIRTK